MAIHLIQSLISRFMISLRDTWSSKYYSRDFAMARGEYLRIRIQVIGLLFVLLTPFWALCDWLWLPRDIWPTVFVARGLMLLGLLACVLFNQKRWLSSKVRVFLGAAVLVLPALFYASVLVALLPYTPHVLIGYAFIPYLLMVTIGVFPFTLLESLLLGLVLIGLQFFAGFVAGLHLNAQALQDLWLLAALLSIVMTINHFLLSLLLRLYRQATHDALTGLLNRVALGKQVEHLQSLNPRPKTAIILLDLDYFKKINDNYGHSVGDEVLRLVAELLRKHTRKNDSVSRYGGEEFLIVSSPTSATEAWELAERLRLLTLELQPQSLDGDVFSISMSLGISMWAADESFEQAIQRADENLYAAKRAGRNTVVA